MERMGERVSDALLIERAELERVGVKGWEQQREADGELLPEEFALRSRRIGGATILAETAAQPWVIHNKGRWRVPQAFYGIRNGLVWKILSGCRELY